MKNPHYHISIGNATDIGKVREHNEDYMAHFDTPFGYCVVVCDGMGGHAAGEVASQNAVDAIKHFLQGGKITVVSTPMILYNVLEFANFKLREIVNGSPGLKGMGTTCVLALIRNSELFVAHAGDSRLYLIRGKGIKQISKDHSTVQNLVDLGALTEEEADVSDRKNEITKALGIFDKVNPTVTEDAIPLFYNDKIVLCSDGLTTHVTNQVIKETVNSTDDMQVAAMQLVEKANNGGGSDNITVQVIHYTGRTSKKRSARKLKKLLVILFIAILTISLSLFGYKEFYISKSKDLSKPTLLVAPPARNERKANTSLTKGSSSGNINPKQNQVPKSTLEKIKNPKKQVKQTSNPGYKSIKRSTTVKTDTTSKPDSIVNKQHQAY